MKKEVFELVKKELGEIILKPFTLILDNLGFFPSENYVKVVWVGVKKEEVVKLYEQVEAKLKGMDFKQDHKFTSHMTLTRVKFLVDRQKFLEQVKKIKVNPIEFKVSSFKNLS